MRRLLAFLLTTLVLSASAATVPPAQFTDPDRAAKMARAFPEIEKQFVDFVTSQHIPGASMAIIIDGNVAWVKATGFRDAAAKSPVTNDTIFRIASMTKSFTAMSVLQLRDAGKLSLDDPVARYIPELATLTPATADSPTITIRHLLTHSEGFPEDNPWGDRQLARTDTTLSTWMRSGIPFSTSPGTAYEYSNYGFMILGQVVQRVSGRPYAEYVRENILVPLGMKDTVFDVRDVPADRIAYGYRWEDDQWKPEPALPHGAGGAMGGLWTTPADLAKYVAFHLAAWPPRDDEEHPPIRRSSAREMQEMWRPATANASRASVDSPLIMTSAGYGYGLRISSDCRFRHIVGHGGGLPGYGSLELWLPEYGVGMVAFGNVTYAGFTPLFNRTLDSLLATGGLQRRQTQPAPALLQAKDDVSKLINRWDDALADSIVAQNFFLDQLPQQRAKEFAERTALLGPCTSGPFTDVENALRGRWRMECNRGWLDVAITLAPTTPPKVQSLSTNVVLMPSESMGNAIATTIALIDRWDETRAKSLATDTAKLRRLTEATRNGWGSCHQSMLLGGDGVKSSVVELACEKGKVVERLTLDPATHKLLDISLAPSRDSACVP